MSRPKQVSVSKKRNRKAKAAVGVQVQEVYQATHSGEAQCFVCSGECIFYLPGPAIKFESAPPPVIKLGRWARLVAWATQ